jgi:predicted ATPase/DNA-binding CsgD family transcriptional regulator
VTQVEPGALLGDVHGFPVALTSFVGRGAEVAEVAGLLGEYRLVTVTGPGGVGKSRLAAEVVRRVADRFADGVWLVELASVREPALVEAAVAVALGLPQTPGMSVLDSLLAVLGRQQVLLVLDNCEHLLAAVAALCRSLLPAVDDVRVLATSREPVGVAGEVSYRLGPLGLPDLGDQAEIPVSEAVRLFADRARLADPHFALDHDSGPAVARLMLRLDGMPLAIELAAARVEALGVAQLLDRLDDRLGLLVAKDRLAAARQRSLAATAQWSYELLTEQDRQVFRKLAVFPGPFTLAAAEAVAGLDAGSAVLRLVDCSLLAPPRTGPDGRARYIMLETLRAYGAERLVEAGEEPGAAAALTAYALSVAEQAAFGTQAGAAQLAAGRWLDAEDATVHQALSWALEHDPVTAPLLAIALAPWWVLRGRLTTGYELLAAAVQDVPRDDNALCGAQYWLGVLASYSDMARALGHYTAAVDAAASPQHLPTLADALANRSRARTSLGRTADGREDAHRALALARERGYPAGEARALLALFFAAEAEGEADQALALARQAARIDPTAIPGKLARMCGEILTRGLRDDGQVDQARRSCADGLSLARQAGDLAGRADFLILAADLALQAGDLRAAAAHIRETIDLASRTGYRARQAECLDTCGHLCAATRRWRDAVTAWAAWAAWQLDAGATDDPEDARRRQEPLQTARQTLGPADTQAAEERGAAMGLAAATEFAMLLAAAELPEPHAPAATGQLSPREKELVTLVARGRSDAQIADQLYISVRTVGSHLDRIRDKTGCRRRADLTRLALQVGLV